MRDRWLRTARRLVAATIFYNLVEAGVSLWQGWVAGSVALLISNTPALASDLSIYPAGGQSEEQMDKDKYECYNWAKKDSGFDPMATPASTSPPPSGQKKSGGVAKGAVIGGATGAIIQFESTGSDEDLGVRKNGSTDTWMLSEPAAVANQMGFLMTGLDANRICEIYVGTTSVDVWLVGYTMEGVTFFTNAVDKSLGTTDSWQDIDISADTGTDTAIGAIFTIHDSSGDGDRFALRKKGSSDNRYRVCRCRPAVRPSHQQSQCPHRLGRRPHRCHHKQYLKWSLAGYHRSRCPYCRSLRSP